MMAAGKGACISVPNKPIEHSETEDGALPEERALVALVQTHSSPYRCGKLQVAPSTL